VRDLIRQALGNMYEGKVIVGKANLPVAKIPF